MTLRTSTIIRNLNDMKVSLYARVSTVDKEQNPLNQLLPMREYIDAQDK